MAESPHADRFEALAASFVKEHRLPGAAVGVVTGGQLIWSAGVGFADRAAQRRPGESTLYRIASITKTFTGTAIMQLRAGGRLELDDSVVSFLPELTAAARGPERLRTSPSAAFSRTSPGCAANRRGRTGPSRATKATSSAPLPTSKRSAL